LLPPVTDPRPDFRHRGHGLHGAQAPNSCSGAG
jgi:hypothetical protein